MIQKQRSPSSSSSPFVRTFKALALQVLAIQSGGRDYYYVCMADQDSSPTFSCGGANVTEFDAPTPPQTATALNLQFTCIYNDFTTDPTKYMIAPTPVIRIEPGDRIAFYSNPPNIYDWVDQDGEGTTLSLAHNPYAPSENDGDGSDGPIAAALVITWPPSQLQSLTVVPDLAEGNKVHLAEGFTALESIEFISNGLPAGLEAYLSTDGTVTLTLAGGMSLGVHVVAVGGTTQLKLDVQTDTVDMEFSSTTSNIVGEVHAANDGARTGNVFVDGVGTGGIVSSGEGPGQLFADSCDRVDGECQSLDGITLQLPDPDCVAVDVCPTAVSTLSQPARVCTLVSSGTPPGCATESVPTEAPSDATFFTVSSTTNVIIMVILLAGNFLMA